jgi:hypothetical protein
MYQVTRNNLAAANLCYLPNDTSLIHDNCNMIHNDEGV